jgi:chromosome segregation ATPase
MTETQLEQFRVYVQSAMAELPTIPTSERISCSQSMYSVAGEAGVLDLVYRAAEVLRTTEDRATDIEARAQKLANRTIEQLKLAEQRLNAVDAERQAIEASVGDAHGRVEELETALRTSEVCISVAEAQLTAAERRAQEAEKRASESRAKLLRIEEAIKTHLLGTRQTESMKLVAA